MKSKPTNAPSVSGAVTMTLTKVDKRPSQSGISGVAMVNPVTEMAKRAAAKKKAKPAAEPVAVG
jgi:hypothetical protein